MASDDIADLDDAGPLRPDATVLDRLGQFLDEQGAALNVSKRLDRLAARAEAAIGQVINLLVIYTVETVILPIAVMLLVYALIKQLWRWPGWRREPHPA